MENLVIRLVSGFRNTLNTLTSSVSSEFSDDNSLISNEIIEIIENPNDKKRLDEAVDYLMNNKTVKEKSVELSNKTIIISLG